ncbi:MAG: hypothetical protein PUF78_07025 [Lachnospiraceae bacterium]|nr:hypothetical protein [Lachnospiraceae bacterium]
MKTKWIERAVELLQKEEPLDAEEIVSRVFDGEEDASFDDMANLFGMVLPPTERNILAFLMKGE